MSKEKQIEEMAEVLENAKIDAHATIGSMNRGFGVWYANALYTAGYRKQSEGEWIQQPRPYEDWIECSVCGANFNLIDNCTEKFNHCPNCGAKMKGGAE